MENENKWHYIDEMLPPEPKTDGKVIYPLTYLCANSAGPDECDCDVDTYLYIGNREFMGENKNYPIYAWYEEPIDIPAKNRIERRIK